MGLFINKNGHPSIFENNVENVSRNQEHFKIDPFAEWLKEQKEATDSVNHQLAVMKTVMTQQESTQSNQLKTIRNRLDGIKQNNLRHELFKNDVMDSFSKIEGENKTLHQMLTNEQLISREFMGKVNEVSHSNQEIATRIETVTTASEKIVVKMNEQLTHQKQLAEKFLKHEDLQKDVINRLDNQEGLSEKLVRQLDHLRSVLYERTSFLTAKIEDSYSMTSSYISKLLTGSDKASTHFLLSQKQEEKKENVD